MLLPRVHRALPRSLPLAFRAYSVGIRSTRLPHRTALFVRGPDAVHFLQGLVTNDVQALESPGVAQNAAFLNRKGRVIAEALVARCVDVGAAAGSGGATFLLDVHRSVADTLLRHTRTFKLRSKVELGPAEGVQVRAVWGGESWAAAAEPAMRDLVLGSSTFAAVVADPRLAALGGRLYVREGQQQQQEERGVGDQDAAAFEAWRLLHGVAEGPEVEGGIPLEFGLDDLNGVHYHKGCYLGQELVARTHFQGLVRKRCLPVLLLGAQEAESWPAGVDTVAALMERAPLVVERLLRGPERADAARLSEAELSCHGAAGRAGKLLAVSSNGLVGLAMLRLDQALVDGGKTALLEVGDHDVFAKPLLPLFWGRAAVEAEAAADASEL